ncbi:MAG: hypothetical protein AABW67_03885 [Nanoarchaeota archaeon]
MNKKIICLDCGGEFVQTIITIKKEKINCTHRCPGCIRKSYGNNHGKITNSCCTARLVNSKPISYV